MNELEFTTWLPTANISALGVQRSKNDTQILALTNDKDATGAARNISSEDLALAQILSTQNEAMVGKKLEIEKNQNAAATLAANARQSQSSNRTQGGQMPLAPDTLVSFPKSIGHLKSFHGDREVLSSHNGRREVLTPDERAYRLGTFIFGAVAGNERTRREYQQKAEGFGLNYLAMNEGAVGSGGYLVPPEFSADFIYLAQEYGVFEKYARSIAVTSNDYRQPRKQSSITAAWEGELATISKSQMGIDQIQVLLKRISSLTDISNELNADSIIGIVDWLVKDSVIQMQSKADDAGFNGDGTLKYGNTIGVIPGLTNIASNKGVVLQGTSTTWAAQTVADIEAMMGALPMFPGMKPKIFCHNNYYRTVLRSKLATAGGTNLLMLAAGGNPYQFDGVEVVISQMLPSTDPGTGTISVLYGDLEFSSTFVHKGEYTIFQANQGDTNVSTNTTSIRIDRRIGMVNHELGSSSLGGAIVGLKSN